MNKSGTAAYKASMLFLLCMVFIVSRVYFECESTLFMVFLPTISLIWLVSELSRDDGMVPLFDAGVICAGITYLYIVIPVLWFYFNGNRFSPIMDSRLGMDVGIVELEVFYFRYIVYFLTYVVVYRIVRKPFVVKMPVVLPKGSVRQIIFSLFLFVLLYRVALHLIYGGYVDNSYAGNLMASQERLSSTPYFITQVTQKITGLFFVVELSVIALLFIGQSYKYKRILIVSIILFELLNAIYFGAGRSGFSFIFLSLALLYHRVVYSLKFTNIVVFITIFIIGFLVFGAFRVSGAVDLGGGIFSSLFLTGNEFISVFATSFDVYNMVMSGENLPVVVYFNDIIGFFPPQQILPFEKISAADWYLKRIGYSGTGVGFMWGVMSQIVIGLDWYELPFRAIIIAVFFSVINDWYRRNQHNFFFLIFYVFICVKSYYVFRDTTFSILTLIVWQFIPFVIVIKVIGTIIPTRTTDKVRLRFSQSE